MRATRLGTALAMTAVAVNGPLLVLALLRADGVPIPTAWRVALLTLRALGTVAVLSLGAAYIAHGAVTHPVERGALVTLWLLVLAGTAVIVTPMVVEAVGAALAPVIPSVAGRWVWALTSVVTVEVSAAGCMLAAGAASRSAGSMPPAPVSPDAQHGSGNGRRAERLAQPGSQLEPASLSLASEAASHRCALCNRHFRSVFALGGHLRHCRVRNDRRDEATGQS